MRTTVIAGAMIGAGLVLGTVPVGAHHAFSAEFDADRPVHFQGTVVKVEWINPHTWIHIDVTREDGEVERWMIEGGNPHNLFRRGFTRDAISIGMEIVVDGYASKDGTRRANGRDLTLPSGQTLFMGSSGTGAPYDRPSSPR
ncbi:MAG: hypothetical protein IH939_05405 [Acidobacteria bacterium]|nr:hypothetical protein [Acidobacteriota bacterium]